ncbi:hypothetical protein [Sessilibacter sp. MAH2]
MSFSYEDLTYIQSALHAYSSDLEKIDEAECDEDYTFDEVLTDLKRVKQLRMRVDDLVENFSEVAISVSPQIK